MKRIHMNQTNKPLGDIIKRVAVQRRGAKPYGFWYGINDSWISWVRSEMPEWETDFKYEIEIDDSKILMIDNDIKMMNFHETYKVKIMEDLTLYDIDWKKVFEDGYTGIEINPYSRSSKFKTEFMWYYGWDVASGCIWDTNIIKSINPIKL